MKRRQAFQSQLTSCYKLGLGSNKGSKAWLQIPGQSSYQRILTDFSNLPRLRPYNVTFGEISPQRTTFSIRGFCGVQIIISDPQHGHLRMRHTRLPPDRSGLARRTLITAGMNRPAQISRRPHSAHNVRLTDLNTQAPPHILSSSFTVTSVHCLPQPFALVSGTVFVGVLSRS